MVCDNTCMRAMAVPALPPASPSPPQRRRLSDGVGRQDPVYKGCYPTTCLANERKHLDNAFPSTLASCASYSANMTSSSYSSTDDDSSGHKCTCDTPLQGTAGFNRYSCSDSSSGSCLATDACYATVPFSYGDWAAACAPLQRDEWGRMGAPEVQMSLIGMISPYTNDAPHCLWQISTLNLYVGGQYLTFHNGGCMAVDDSNCTMIGANETGAPSRLGGRYHMAIYEKLTPGHQAVEADKLGGKDSIEPPPPAPPILPPGRFTKS